VLKTQQVHMPGDFFFNRFKFVAVAVFLGTVSFAIAWAASSDKVSGWAWSETIGWIAFNQTDLVPVITASTHWGMDEVSGMTMSDGAGALDGILRDDMGDHSWVPGKFGNGLEFDGDKDWVDVPPEAINGKKLVTISVWFKTSESLKRQVLMSGVGFDTTNAPPEFQEDQFVIYLKEGFTFIFRDSDDSLEWVFGNNLADGAWHNAVIIRHDLTGLDFDEVTLYMDGV
jgi:hypothetical protein